MISSPSVASLPPGEPEGKKPSGRQRRHRRSPRRDRLLDHRKKRVRRHEGFDNFCIAGPKKAAPSKPPRPG
ncbi:MAG: hypothetical protein CW342_06335 [Thermoactinomycetaceae bacterium]|nr:hypothetical protein [Bacillota bacterium]MBO2532500.1 hypothetical protein [Thermoactinomycetaceae bacterium]